MKTTIARILVAAACLAASTAQAQWTSYRPDKSLFLLGWGLAQPLNFEEYQSGTSVEGFSLEFRSMVKPRISVGLAFDYNRFERTKSLETQQQPGGATVSGPTYRYADEFAIKLTGHYYLLDGPLRPYLGAGIGGDWSYAYVQSADLSRTDSGFHFIVTPEVGLSWVAASGATSVGVNVAVRYNFSTATPPGVDNAQWLSEVVGISVSY